MDSLAVKVYRVELAELKVREEVGGGRGDGRSDGRTDRDLACLAKMYKNGSCEERRERDEAIEINLGLEKSLCRLRKTIFEKKNTFQLFLLSVPSITVIWDS